MQSKRSSPLLKECPEKRALSKPHLSSASFSLLVKEAYVSALRALPSRYVKEGAEAFSVLWYTPASLKARVTADHGHNEEWATLGTGTRSVRFGIESFWTNERQV